MPIKADKSLRAYYNEIDPFAAQWIRNLMAEGWITKGDVDERSIEDVQPNDLTGYDRLHFFAGVAVWDYALNQAGWGRGEIWTGSCPCQPFSAAGKGSGFDDQRHLWPAFHHLIQECKPSIVLGEQVASKDADPWINLVQADVEALGYGFGAVPFPSASVGAPHIRDRLYWVAHSEHGGRGTGQPIGRWASAALPSGAAFGLADMHSNRCNQAGQCVAQAGRDGSAGNCAACGLADATNERQHGRRASQTSNGRDAAWVEPERLCDGGRVVNTQSSGWARQSIRAAAGGSQVRAEERGDPLRAGPVNGFWSDADWLFCRDGKWRPVEPGTFPLVDGAAGRLGRVRAGWHASAGKEGFGHRARRLKGYGNAINAEAARVFIECVMEVA